MASPLNAFDEERATWRAIIQLNVIRSVRLILDAMDRIPAPSSTASRSPYGAYAASSTDRDSSYTKSTAFESYRNLADGTLVIRAPSPPPPPSGANTRSAPPSMPSMTLLSQGLTQKHRELRMRLSPLLQIEDALLRILATTTTEPALFGGTPHAWQPVESHTKAREVAVNVNAAGGDWKNKLARLVIRNKGGATSGLGADPSASCDAFGAACEAGADGAADHDPGLLLIAHRADIAALWADPVVHELLLEHKGCLKDISGLFLDSLDRVCTPGYVPTDGEQVCDAVRLGRLTRGR
jgi:hypothetical protein